MRCETVEQLLSLTETELLTTENCGPKTTARILQLQAEYGKDITPPKPRQAIGKVVANTTMCINRLSAVVLAANELIDEAKKDEHNRYYFRVTTKRINVLKRSLEALGKQKEQFTEPPLV